jgi:hypothetical protein
LWLRTKVKIQLILINEKRFWPITTATLKLLKSSKEKGRR